MRICGALLLLVLGTGAALGETISGSCLGTLAQSDGVYHKTTGLNAKDFFAQIKKAKESGRKLGPDGYMWATKPVACNSLRVSHEGEKMIVSAGGVTFSGPATSAPFFRIDEVKIDGLISAQLSSSAINDRMCQFAFSNHGGFDDGWEGRISEVSCKLKFQTNDGLIVTQVNFRK